MLKMTGIKIKHKKKFESSSMWVVACLKVALFVTECATLQYEADLEDLHDHVTVKVPA